MRHKKDLAKETPRKADVHVRGGDEEDEFAGMEAKNAEVKERAEREEVEEVGCRKCCWAGWGRGEVAVLSYLPGMTHIRAECHHIHGDESRDGGNDQVTAHEAFTGREVCEDYATHSWR